MSNDLCTPRDWAIAKALVKNGTKVSFWKASEQEIMIRLMTSINFWISEAMIHALGQDYSKLETEQSMISSLAMGRALTEFSAFPPNGFPSQEDYRDAFSLYYQMCLEEEKQKRQEKGTKN